MSFNFKPIKLSISKKRFPHKTDYNKQIVIRVRPCVDKELKQNAEQKNISLNMYINEILEKAVKKTKKVKKCD